MLNRIIIMGRLTRDPELRHTAANVPVTSFSIAHERDYKDADGNKITDFYDVAAWRNTAEFAAKWLSKGRLVVVCGKTQLRTYTDSEGRKRTKLELIADEVYFADGKNNTSPTASGSPQGEGFDEAEPVEVDLPENEWEELVGEDKDLPF